MLNFNLKDAAGLELGRIRYHYTTYPMYEEINEVKMKKAIIPALVTSSPLLDESVRRIIE